MSSRIIVDIIKNYCETNNISLELLSSDWILKLTRNNIIKYIHGYQFDLNSSGTMLICNDKSATSDILELAGIPCVKHELILPGFTQEKVNIANSLFNKYNKKVVCKTNNGSGGKDVFLIDNFDDLIEKMKYLFSKDQYVSISPYYEITNEYRVIILDNEVKLIYSKKRTNNWKHNLGLGAEPIIVVDNLLSSKLSNIALSAYKAVSANFASVDILDVSGKFMVLEINSGVMMEHFASKNSENYKIAEKIYTDAVKLMFENNI